MNRKGKKNGFTLIELLATISILAIIISVVVYVAISVINNAREESYRVTIVNIENNAKDYFVENSSKLFYVHSEEEEGNYEYQCVTVQSLIDMGYFKSDVLDSKVSKDRNVNVNDYVYLLRDRESKTLIKSMYTYGNEDSLNCEYALSALGDIVLYVQPSDWSQSKNIAIYYELKNTLSPTNYKYQYEYVVDGGSRSGYLDSDNNKKTILVNDNGTLYTRIINRNDNTDIIAERELKISNIDNVKPICSFGKFSKNIISDGLEAEIILTCQDSSSGVKDIELKASDIILSNNNISIVDVSKNKITNGYEYTFKIKGGNIDNGSTNLILPEDIIFDLAGNGNESVISDEVRTNVIYNINYYLGNQSNSVTKLGTQSCTYGMDCKLKSFSEFGVTFPFSLENQGKGWKFYGWVNSNENFIPNIENPIDYTDGDAFVYDYDEDINLYALGMRDLYFYSGVNPKTPSYTEKQYWNSYSNDQNYLTNVTIPNATVINKWSFVGYKSGNSDADSKNLTYEASKVGNKIKVSVNTDNHIRGLYQRDIKFKFSCTDGVGSKEDIIKRQYYNTGYSLNNSNIRNTTNIIEFSIPDKSGCIRTGYKFNNWNTLNNGNGTGYDVGSKYIYTDNTITNVSNEITFYATWISNKVKIKYNVNGGILSDSSKNNGYSVNNSVIYYNGTNILSSIDYGKQLGGSGLYNYNNNDYINITKLGYTVTKGEEWICLSNECKEKVYNQATQYKFSDFCDLESDDCTVELGVNWKPITYNIEYVYNGGTGGTYKQNSAVYDESVRISTPSKTVTINGDVNGTGALVGESTSSKQNFSGWTYSNGNSGSAKYGTKSNSINQSWSSGNNKVNVEYFKNLRNTSGTISLTANWTPVSLSLPTISKSGYTCGWNTSSSGTEIQYTSGENYTPSATSSSSITMYAVCILNKAYVQLNVNGGIITANTTYDNIDYSWATNSNGLISRTTGSKTSDKFFGVNSGSTKDLPNPDGTYLNIKRNGYKVINGEEWICLSNNCKKDKYSDTTKYSANDFCDTSNGPCTVELGVNWKKSGIDNFDVSIGKYQTVNISNVQTEDDSYTIKYSSGIKDDTYFKSSGTDITSSKKFTVSSNGVYTIAVSNSIGEALIKKVFVYNFEPTWSTSYSGTSRVNSVSVSGISGTIGKTFTYDNSATVEATYSNGKMSVKVNGGSYYDWDPDCSYYNPCPDGGTPNESTLKCTGSDEYKVFYHDLKYVCSGGVITFVAAGGDNPCELGYEKKWGELFEQWSYVKGDSCSPDDANGFISGGAPFWRNCVWNGDYDCNTTDWYHYRNTLGILVK